MALSKFDSLQSTGTALKEFVADGRLKWVAIATELKMPDPVVVVPEQQPLKMEQAALPEVLDVPAAARELRELRNELTRGDSVGS